MKDKLKVLWRGYRVVFLITKKHIQGNQTCIFKLLKEGRGQRAVWVNEFLLCI